MTRYAILLLPVLLGACARGYATPGTESAPPVLVRLAEVEIEKMALPVTGTGTLGLKEELTLGFKVGGVVARILVDEGERVREGQLLAALDLGEIDPAVARARSAADKAERDLARARRLFADSVVSLAQVQDAETSRDVAVAELQSLRFNRRHAEIVAPADGVILQRRAEAGELVGPGAPILVLGSYARGQVVRVGLADRDVVRIRRGDRARVEVAALPGTVLDGTVSEVAAAADPATGTYQVEVSLPLAAPIASGLVGKVEILPVAERTVALVPVDAVLEADGSSGVVFTPGRDGRAERRVVTLAFLAGDRMAVAAGLEGVERVVTEGAANLDPGDAMEVRP